MRTRLALALVPLVFAFVGSGSPGASDIPEEPYTITRLGSRVIVLECLNVNVTAIAARSGIVVIDTNRSPRVMRRLRSVIEEEFRRHDFIYLINTHGDPDHSSGNPAFPSVPLIAHQDYAAFVLHAKASTLHNEWTMRSRLEEARTEYEALDPKSKEAGALRTRISDLESRSAELIQGRIPRMPAVTFKDSLNLDLGDLTLELRFCGEAHTNHDIVAYVPEEKLLLSGDLICSPQSPCFGVNAVADVPRLVRELEGLLRRKEGLETVVPGHGRVLTGTELSGFCRLISERFGEIRIERSAARIVGLSVEREGIRAALEHYPPPSPDDPGALDWSEGEFGTLGIRLVRKGMIDEAVGVLELAVRALPGSAYLYGCLGDARIENGDWDGAAVAYGKSSALEQDSRYAADMLKALRAGR